MATITPTRETLERIIRRYVSRGAELDRNLVIPISDTDPRPQQPYASLALVRDERIGYPEVRAVHNPQGDVTDTITQSVRQASYDVSFYYDTHKGELFAHWIESPKGINTAARYEIRVRQYGDLIRMDEVVQEAWEQRLIVQLKIAYNTRYEDTSENLPVNSIVVSHDAGVERINLEE